jgi:hypothetical protein
MSPPDQHTLAAAREATDFLLNLLHQVGGDLRVLAPSTWESLDERSRSNAALLAELFVGYVLLEHRLAGCADAIRLVVPHLRHVRTWGPLQMGGMYCSCAAEGVVALAVQARHLLRPPLQSLAAEVAPTAASEGNLHALARAVALAYGTPRLTKLQRGQLGDEGLQVYDRLRGDVHLQAAASDVLEGRFVRGMREPLRADLPRLRAEVGQEFDRTGSNPPPVTGQASGFPVETVAVSVPLTPQDFHILTVLDAHHGGALTYARIVNESVRMEQRDRGKMRRLSDSSVRIRVTVLLSRGLVERPVGTKKKGVGITDAGRKALSFARGNPTETQRKK